MLEGWQTMINTNSKLYAHVRGHVHTCCTLSDTSPIPLADNVTLHLYHFVCLFVCFQVRCVTCMLCLCVYISVAHYSTLYTYSVFLSELDVHSHTIPHMHAGGPLSLCAHVCTHSHTICAHASLSQRKGGCIHLSQSIFWR